MLEPKKNDGVQSPESSSEGNKGQKVGTGKTGLRSHALTTFSASNARFCSINARILRETLLRFRISAP